MIPPEFDYLRPHSVDEAVTELGRAGEDAKVLAGGQSLLPLLRLRLAYPTVLVDLGGVGEAGTIASTPAVVNAVVDAVRQLGVSDIPMPCSPYRVWKALQEGARS